MRNQTNNFLSLFLALSGFLFFCQTLSAQVVPVKVMLKAGTPIPLRIEETASSETCTAGQSIMFSVTRDVVVDDIVVIKAGIEARGEVSHVEASGSMGEEGALTLVARSTTAVNGERVPLRATISKHGKEKRATAFMVCPFIKGTKCVIPGGTELKAYVDYDTKLTILTVE